MTILKKLHLIYSLQKILVFLVLFVVLGCHVTFAQYDIPKKPEMQTSVYDYANLLSSVEKTSLENKLITYSDTTSTQIVVAIINTAQGENIGLLAPRWAQEWGIGQAKEDNGVFVLLATEDRKIWIAPGYGVEHKLTAGITGELIRNVIIPEFKQGNYYGGLDKGSDAIFKVLNGEYQGTRNQSNHNSSGFQAGTLFMIFIIFLFIILSISRNKRGGSNNGNNRGNRLDSRDLLEAIILSNLGRGSFGRGSSAGGGAGGSW